MCRQRNEIGVPRYLAIHTRRHLCGIDQQQMPGSMNLIGQVGDRLADPGFAIRPLNRDDRTPFTCHRGIQRGAIDQPRRLHRHQRDIIGRA